MNFSKKNLSLAQKIREHKKETTPFLCKTRIQLKKISLILWVLCASNVALAQTIITIDNNSGSTTTYQTIQAAHDDATAGDILYVQPSGISYD